MTLEQQVTHAVARGWCDPRNAGKVMDPDLADAIVREVVDSFTPAFEPAQHLLLNPERSDPCLNPRTEQAKP